MQHRLLARCACHMAGRSVPFQSFGFSSSRKHFEADRPFAIDHLACDWTVEVIERSLSGSVALTVERVAAEGTTLWLDAVAFEIEAITLDEEAVPYTYDGERIAVRIPAQLQRGVVRVHYRVTPQRGLYFLAPDAHVPDRPRQIWTQCQEQDARYFVPCHDSPHVKMTTEVRVRVPSAWQVLSNGECVERSPAEQGNTLHHFVLSQPQASYLLTLVAGEFAVFEQTVPVPGGEVPLAYYVPQNKLDDARASFANTARMLQFLNERLGVTYPWTRYSQVVVADFPGGGMENTTATTLYEHTIVDAKARLDVSADDLIVHELAHQWFGDLVTCREWAEGWLNEGFATYAEHLWREHDLGADELAYGLEADRRAYLAEAKGRYVRPVVCKTYDAPYDLFDRHLYEKGGLFLHRLRHELGDAAFFAGVTRYLERHAHGVVETRDLQRALEETSGRGLGRLFDEGVHSPGHPVVEVEIAYDEGLLTLKARQTQSPEQGVPKAFEVPLEVQIVHDDGSVQAEKLWLRQRQDGFAFAVAGRPRAVIVDERMLVLGEIAVRAPRDMLHRQLETAPTARGRWIAAQSLANCSDMPTLRKLAARVGDESEFWGVRVEAARALGNSRATDAADLLIRLLDVQHPKVRRAVAMVLSGYRSVDVARALQPLALGDESVLVQAEAARSLGATRQSLGFETLVELLTRPSWAEVVAVGAIDGLASLRDERACEHVVARTRYGVATRVRRAAVRAVVKLLDGDKARELLEDLLVDADPNLRIDVAHALVDLGDIRARRTLSDWVERDLDPRARRAYREALRSLSAAAKRPDRALQDDIARLERSLSELRDRVTELTARQAGPSSPAREIAVATRAKGRSEAADTRKKTMPSASSPTKKRATSKPAPRKAAGGTKAPGKPVKPRSPR